MSAKLLLKVFVAGVVGSAVGQMTGPRLGIEPSSGPGLDDGYNGGVTLAAFILLHKMLPE